MTLPGLMMLDTSITDWDTLQRLWQDPIIRSHSKHLKFWVKTMSSSVHYYYHFEKQLQAYCWGQTTNECLIIDHQIIIRPKQLIMKQVSSDPQTIKLGSTTILHCHMVVVCTRLSSTEQFVHMPTGHIHTASTPASQPSLIAIWRFPYNQQAKKTMASFRDGDLYTDLLWSGPGEQ